MILLKTEQKNELDGLFFHKLCKSIFDLSQEIESVHVINHLGRIIEEISNDEHNSRTDKKSEILFMQIVLENSMKQEHDVEFGKINYSMTNRAKKISFSFPFARNLILVLTSNKVNTCLISKKIQRKLNRFNHQID